MNVSFEICKGSTRKGKGRKMPITVTSDQVLQKFGSLYHQPSHCWSQRRWSQRRFIHKDWKSKGYNFKLLTKKPNVLIRASMTNI